MKKETNSLNEKLNAFKNKHEKKTNLKKEDTHLGYGIKISIDLVTTIFVSIMIGLGIDKILNTKPIFFLTFIILGIIASFMNLYRNLKISEEKRRETNKDG